MAELRHPGGRRALACSALLLLSACDDATSGPGPWTISGAATRYGRVSHAGIRVVVEPDGPETVTDSTGGWLIVGAPDENVTLRFESPGFAPEVRRVWSPGEQAPIALFRGRSVPLPVDLEVTAAEEVPPAGLLLTGAGGERVLVDLALGKVGLTLGPDWRPNTSADGYVVGVDAVTGAVSGRTPDGAAVEGPGGFTPRGNLSTADGARQGVLLSRPVAGQADALVGKDRNRPQELVWWAPGAEPIAFDRPVLAVGPTLTDAGGGEDVTLLVSDGWVRWSPGRAPERLADVAPEHVFTTQPLFGPAGATRTLCYVWGDFDTRAIDCVGADTPAHTVAALPADAEAATPALVSAEPPLVVWRDPALGLCRAALGTGAAMPAPFPCRPAQVAARTHGDAVVFQDTHGELHRLAPDAYTALGPGRALTGNAAVLGYLAGGRWLTLLQPDGTTLAAAQPCGPTTTLHVAGDTLLALDPEARQALHLNAAGRTGALPLLEADFRAAALPTQVSRAADLVSLAGPSGFLRLDLELGEAFSLVHRGWRFLDFSWPTGASPDTELPEIALLRTRDRVRAVDLYTLNSEPLGEGTQAGLLNGRAWFVHPRGLYIVDDPAAE